MATRFYFSTTAHPFVVTPQAAWERSIAAATTRRSYTTKQNTALTDVASLFGATTTTQTRWMSYLTPPLTADFSFLTSHTFSMVLRGLEATLAEDSHLAYQLRVITPAGTERGLLAGSMTTVGELAVTAQTRIFNAIAMTAVSALRGDRLCLEVGCHGVTPANAGNITWRFGDPTGTADFALTANLTTDLTPWWEISANPTFATTDNITDLAGSQPASTGNLSRLYSGIRALLGSQPTSTGELDFIPPGPTERTLTGNQPSATSTIARVYSAVRDLVGSQPTSTGISSRLYQAFRVLVGNQPSSTGVLTRLYIALRGLGGSQPSATSTLVRLQIVLRTLTGNQPSSTGILSRLQIILRSLTGSQPSSTNALTRIKHSISELVGLQPSDSSSVTRIYAALRGLDGVQASDTGVLVGARQSIRTLVGQQPFATSSLTKLIVVLRELVGNQPFSVGDLIALKLVERILTGIQPESIGFLSRSSQLFRTLTGIQPSAVNTIIGSFYTPGKAIASVLLHNKATATLETYAKAIARVTRNLV